MGSSDDVKVFSSMKAATRSKSGRAETSLRKARRVLDENRLLTLALQCLSEDWKQPAEQHPLQVVINRWSFVKDGRDYWAEEMVDDLEQAQKGRPKTFAAREDEFSAPAPSKDLVPAPIGPLSAADKRPCAACAATAYVVWWQHETDHDESFGARIHNKLYLLCPACKGIAPLNENTCDKCA